MKFIIPSLLTLTFSTFLYADVWEKPPYVPDENHLPESDLQRQQERQRKKEVSQKEMKQKQECECPEKL